MIYEWKKWWGIPIIKYLCMIIVICPIFSVVHFINGYETYIVLEDQIVEISGYKAFKSYVHNKKNQSHLLTEKCSEQALHYMQENWEKENIYSQMEVKYPGYFSVLYGAYQSQLYGEKENIMDKKNKSSFYQAVAKRREEKLIIERNGKVDKGLKDYVMNQGKRIQIPFTMGERGSWIILIKSLYLSFLILSFICVIWGAVVFSIDKDQKMDFVLYNTKDVIKKLRKIKIQLFLSIQLISISYIVGICSSILLLMGGLKEEISIQVLPHFLTSIYHWNMREFMIVYILVATLGILTFTYFISIISDVFKNYISSTLVGSLFPFLFVFFKNKSGLPVVLERIVPFSYITSIDCVPLATRISPIDMLGVKINLIQGNIIVNIVLSFLFYMIYRKLFKLR